MTREIEISDVTKHGRARQRPGHEPWRRSAQSLRLRPRSATGGALHGAYNVALQVATGTGRWDLVRAISIARSTIDVLHAIVHSKAGISLPWLGHGDCA